MSIAAATYYASPGDNLSSVISGLSAGDILILRDGTYSSSMSVAVSGTSSQPITIRAENDGKAIVDGQMDRIPLQIPRPSQYLVIEGIRFQNSSGGTANIYGSNITLRRISAYTSGEGNVHVFEIGYNHNILLEDCAASGKGRNLYLIYEADHVTLRRCWGWWMARNGTGEANYVIQIYASDNTLIENCVGTIDPNPNVNNVSGLAFWIADWNNTDSCNNNSVVGNIYYGFNYHDIWHGNTNLTQTNNSIVNTVLLGGGYTGIFQRGGKNFTLEKTTLINQGKSWSTFRIDNQAGDGPTAVIKNSSFVNGENGIAVGSGTSATHSFNNFSNVTNRYSGTSQGTGEIAETAQYHTTEYGKGAYLMIPSNLKGRGENGTDIGAEVLYQLENGVLTNKPLWPWPMEDRIRTEMQELFGKTISVTWETNGGIWKTLDGIYNSSPTSTPTANPTPYPHCQPLGDTDCSGKVNSLDFAYLVARWNTSDPKADLDNSGFINALDVRILLSNYDTVP